MRYSAPRVRAFSGKGFLTTIEEAYPKFPQKVIFFTQSDSSYYGLPKEEKVLPIQSGFGRMLLVWYQDKEKFSGCLYENLFLHGLLSQGYKQCDVRGFGYFRDYDKLAEAVRQNQIQPENIIAYSWNGKTQKFTSITEQIRRKLADVLELR